VKPVGYTGIVPGIQTVYQEPLRRVIAFGPVTVGDSVVVLGGDSLSDYQRSLYIDNEGDEDLYLSHDPDFTTSAGPRMRLAAGESLSVPATDIEDTKLYLRCAAGKSTTVSGARYA